MQLDLLELAIPDLRGVEVVPINTAWGPTDTAFCYASGVLLGSLSSNRLGRGDRFSPQLNDLLTIQLTPMLHLPTGASAAPLPLFLGAVRLLACSVTRWVVWCEPDLDQAALPEIALEPQELVNRLVIALQPGPLDRRTFIATHGL
jgi:hypothetical protein